MESAAKRAKTGSSGSSGSSSPVTIGTHSGHFHADEALAVHMLRMLPTYRGASLVRTRDPAKLAACHTVVDVGGSYDVEARRFDHHQRGFDVVFPGRKTKLSSAGLVFLHFGRAVIARRLALQRQKQQQKQQQQESLDAKMKDSPAADTEAMDIDEEVQQDTPEVELLHRKIYTDFIEALDAHDNGIPVYDPSALAAANIPKRHTEAGFTLGAVVGRLNPNWNDPPPPSPEAAQRREDDLFALASRRIGEEFERELDYCVTAWLPARAIVERAFSTRSAHDPSSSSGGGAGGGGGGGGGGRLLVLDGQPVPWKDHLYTLEQGKPQVLYVLYPESASADAKWRIQAVPEDKDSFVSRKPLPEAWRGVRDEELDGVAGVKGCVFVHAAGFIGGNKTFEGVKEMALKALAA